MAQIQHSFSRNDEYYTPAYAVRPIINYLKPGTVIWCPFDTEESQYVKIFTENGFTVIHGHIRTGQDFLPSLCRTATISSATRSTAGKGKWSSGCMRSGSPSPCSSISRAYLTAKNGLRCSGKTGWKCCG